jgi:excinuclease ABC subunit B
LEQRIAALEKDMKTAAKALEFERAAQLRDTIRALRQKLIQVGI